MLGLPADNLRIIFTSHPSIDNKQHVRVETRSLLGMMYYLSHATRTPQEDLNSGKVTLTRDASGKPFDWADVTLRNGVKGIFGLSAGASVEENPTVSYAPLQGEQFIQRFLSHIPLQNIFLLTRSGWSFERIFRVCLERVGDLKNAPTASGPTPLNAPVFSDFAKAASLIRKLQLQDAHTLLTSRK